MKKVTKDDFWGNQKLLPYQSDFQINLNGMHIAFLVGSFTISGGTNLIIQYAESLTRLGANVELISILNHEKKDLSWHSKWKSISVTTMKDAKSKRYNLVIATWWATTSFAAELKSESFLYFIQSIESRFAKNDQDLELERRIYSTYFLGIPTITVAEWMQRYLFETTGQLPWHIPNGIDKSLFNEIQRVPETDKIRVLVEGNYNSPMKAVEETIDNLLEIPGIELTYIDPTGDSPKISSINRLIKVPFNQMPSIYKANDVLVKMSRVEGLFGPPLEMFHCGGTAIVSSVTGHSEYIENGVNAIVVPVDDFREMRERMKLLTENPESLGSLRSGARKTAANWPEIDETALKFARVCFHVVNQEIKQGPRWSLLNDLHDSLQNISQYHAESTLYFPKMP